MHDTSPFADPPPKWIHVVCTTERASEIIVNLTGVRNGHCSWSPQLVWEPLGVSSPFSTRPSGLIASQAALQRI